MLIKTGGGSPSTGLTAGIHWHMNIENETTYVAADPQRQQIPWVRIRNRRTGETTEYKLEGAEMTDDDVRHDPDVRIRVLGPEIREYQESYVDGGDDCDRDSDEADPVPGQTGNLLR